MSEKTTRDRILDTAIDMFADKGYNNVSIREIAREVGIKGSSIYNHFKSKEDILDSILEYNKRAGKSNFEGSQVMEGINVSVREMPLESILLSILGVSLSFMKTADMDKIFKVISAEQLNNDKVREFFLEEYIEQPRKVLEVVFDKLMDEGLIREFNPKLLADEFYSYIIFKYYENYLLKKNTELDLRKMNEDFGRHISFFCELIKRNEGVQ